MRLGLVLLGFLATAHAFTNGTCLENLPDSISCRWRDAVSAWDASPRPLSSVAVVYYQPPTLKQGDVGLIRALDVWTRTTTRRVLLLNVAALEKARPAHPGELCHFLKHRVDHLIVKSNWDYVVDVFVRRYLWEDDGTACALTRSLQIAGSYPPARGVALHRFYDVLFAETRWYLSTFLRGRHPRLLQAFGIDADAVRAACNTTAKEWDHLFVGAFGDHLGFKRPEALAQFEGRRLAIGKIKDNGGAISELAQKAIATLEASGVIVREEVPWAELMSIVASSSAVVVPDDWRGGGERAVLEARACGTQVIVADDNPKLQELRTGPIYSTLYYAGQLELGLLEVEAALVRSSDTCGVAAVRGDADGCVLADDYHARLPEAELRKPLEAHLRGEL
jgi:hypothetical protein